jgi:hypothetical protein
LRLDQRIDSELAQEAAELRRLASGNGPKTGTPFGSRVRRIFTVYLERKHGRPDFLDLATVEVGALTEELHAKVRHWPIGIGFSRRAGAE